MVRLAPRIKPELLRTNSVILSIKKCQIVYHHKHGSNDKGTMTDDNTLLRLNRNEIQRCTSTVGTNSTVYASQPMKTTLFKCKSPGV